jgi:hypothetical protein
MIVAFPRWLKRLVRGAALPEGVDLDLSADERVLVWAAVTGGGYLVPTSLGLWVPEGDGHRRIGWHLVSKAAWDGRALSVIEADEVGSEGDAVLIADRPPRRFPLAEPGQVPQVVHARVTRSVLHSEPEPDGGLRVQRRVPGRDGVQVQIRKGGSGSGAPGASGGPGGGSDGSG